MPILTAEDAIITWEYAGWAFGEQREEDVGEWAVKSPD